MERNQVYIMRIRFKHRGLQQMSEQHRSLWHVTYYCTMWRAAVISYARQMFKVLKWTNSCYHEYLGFEVVFPLQVMIYPWQEELHFTLKCNHIQQMVEEQSKTHTWKSKLKCVICVIQEARHLSSLAGMQQK